jgi:DNA-binding response OmpR family regulator
MYYNKYRVLYKRDILLVTYSKEDIKEFINTRSIFNNISDDNISNIHIEDIDYITDNDLDYILISPYRDMYMTTIEYRILNILYENNPHIYNRYSLYQFIYSHPIFNITNIDEYISYRNKLDRLCELDIDYENLKRTFI